MEMERTVSIYAGTSVDSSSNIENYLSACYLSYRISLDLSLADIWPCAFYRSNINNNVCTLIAKCAPRVFFRALPGSHRFRIRRGKKKRKKGEIYVPRCHTCCTRVRERHVLLGATSRPRLMFQRCQVKRLSCSLYHSDLDEINRQTRLFDHARRSHKCISSRSNTLCTHTHFQNFQFQLTRWCILLYLYVNSARCRFQSKLCLNNKEGYIWIKELI